jgi:uncharacterized membrane protein
VGQSGASFARPALLYYSHMSIQTFLTLYAISVPVFFIIDMLWLGVIARDFYQTRLGHLLGEVNWPAAIIFYLVFLVGLTIFAIYPGATVGKVTTALIWGALFGFFTYATYDLTNLATLKDWPLSVVVVDIIWGTVLGASVAGLTVYLYKLFG